MVIARFQCAATPFLGQFPGLPTANLQREMPQEASAAHGNEPSPGISLPEQKAVIGPPKTIISALSAPPARLIPGRELQYKEKTREVRRSHQGNSARTNPKNRREAL
jgi:hypothetical protein